MIPNFKTYIAEGVWGNISKRAEGTLDRKEDNINKLDFFELMDYIDKNYNILDDDVYVKSTSDDIPYKLVVTVVYKNYKFGIYLEYTLQKNSDDKHIIVTNTVKEYTYDIYCALKDKYNMKNSQDYAGFSCFFEITPKDGRKNDNSFFLEILDLMIGFNPENLRITKK